MQVQYQLFDNNYNEVEENADICIINTCTVTGIADRKSRQYIRKMKRVSPDAVVAVCGCYSQVSPEDLMEMPEVDIVTGNGEKEKLIRISDTTIKLPSLSYPNMYETIKVVIQDNKVYIEFFVFLSGADIKL